MLAGAMEISAAGSCVAKRCDEPTLRSGESGIWRFSTEILASGFLLSTKASSHWNSGPLTDRGLVPRLSIGTLQLSIRCSSIHFLPSRSLPVSASGTFEGNAAPAGCAIVLSCAVALV